MMHLDCKMRHFLTVTTGELIQVLGMIYSGFSSSVHNYLNNFLLLFLSKAVLVKLLFSTLINVLDELK